MCLHSPNPYVGLKRTSLFWSELNSRIARTIFQKYLGKIEITSKEILSEVIFLYFSKHH
jgi:hypothetical protein